MPVRVLIVDDSAVIRGFLTDVLASDPAIEVVGTASDAEVARSKIKDLNPDVLTLDVEMPGMDGLRFLDNLMRLRPMPVIMVSSLTQPGTGVTLEALDAGAVDFVAKPLTGAEQSWTDFSRELTAKVKAAAGASLPWSPPAPQTLSASGQPEADRLVAIGGSTGSVLAIQHVLTALPAESPPIVIAVHMPPKFTAQFADRLAGMCRITVREATQGLRLEPGLAVIAPGDQHLTIRRAGAFYVCQLEQGPRVNGHIPSVDVMFESVAQTASSNAIGIILTGMGRDGASGLKAIRLAGGLTVGQDEETSLIYGMPKVALSEGAVCTELPLDRIAHYILKHGCHRSADRRVAAT